MAYGFITIRRTNSGNPVRVKADAGIIRMLGWGVLDDGFGEYGQPARGTGYTTTRPLGRAKAHKGGTPMRISFHPSKYSTQPGKAFRFRINKSATKPDLIRLAAATQGDWCWMTDLSGRRINREQWLAWSQGTLLIQTP